MKKLFAILVLVFLVSFGSPAYAENILNLTNNSGGAVTSGQLVILDVTADDSFTTTTDSYHAFMIGVIPYRRGGISISIADGTKGPVQISGIAALLCDEAIAKGDYISTGSIAGQGTGDAMEPVRYIGIAVSADASAPYLPNVQIIPQIKDTVTPPDHGTLPGLNDADHDAVYFQESEFLASSAGAGDSGKPIKLDANGHVDASMINDPDVAHSTMTNDETSGNPHSVTKAEVALSLVLNIKHKIDATQAPTVNNDVDEGYTAGSIWTDVTNDKSYICLDNTDGAAVWTETTASGLVDIVDDASPQLGADLDTNSYNIILGSMQLRGDNTNKAIRIDANANTITDIYAGFNGTYYYILFSAAGSADPTSNDARGIRWTTDDLETNDNGSWGDIASGGGDMDKATYDSNTDDLIDEENIHADIARATGDDYTGDHDMSAADSWTPPTGVDPDVGTLGAHSWDQNDMWTRVFDGERQVISSEAHGTLAAWSINKPLYLADAATHAVVRNHSKAIWIITGIYSESDTDNVDFILKVTNGNDWTDLTIIEAISIQDDGTGVYEDSVTAGDIDENTINPGDAIVIDNDATDDPKWIAIHLMGYKIGDVN